MTDPDWHHGPCEEHLDIYWQCGLIRADEEDNEEEDND